MRAMLPLSAATTPSGNIDGGLLSLGLEYKKGMYLIEDEGSK